MAGYSTIDFTQGIDFTGLNPATGADHNSLINLATPKDDGAFGGKGLVLVTIDSALDTPIVPNAGTTTKWKSYLWLRKMHSTSTSKTPILYAWNDQLDDAVTFLKWRDVRTNTASLEADITAIEADIVALNTSVGNAFNLANAANNQSDIALQNSIDAEGAAGDATTLANEGIRLGTEALALSNTAMTQASVALAASGGKGSPKDALIPGTSGQMLRVNSAGTEVEYFNVKNTYVKCYAGAVQSTVGNNRWTPINITVEEFDLGNLCELDANRVKLLAGIYYVKIMIPTGAVGRRQVMLGNNNTKTVLLRSMAVRTATDICYLSIEGIITLTTTTVLDLCIYAGVESKTICFGQDLALGSATVNGLPAGYNALGMTDVHTTFEAWKIG